MPGLPVCQQSPNPSGAARPLFSKNGVALFLFEQPASQISPKRLACQLKLMRSGSCWRILAACEPRQLPSKECWLPEQSRATFFGKRYSSYFGQAWEFPGRSHRRFWKQPHGLTRAPVLLGIPPNPNLSAPPHRPRTSAKFTAGAARATPLYRSCTGAQAHFIGVASVATSE